MAPRIKRVYKTRSSSSSFASQKSATTDVSFLSLYRQEKAKPKESVTAVGEEVKRMREELKQREQKILQELTAFKAKKRPDLPPPPPPPPLTFSQANATVDQAALGSASPMMIASHHHQQQNHQEPSSPTAGFVDSLLVPPFDAHSFAFDSPIVQDSCVLEGELALINAFSSPEGSFGGSGSGGGASVPGSSKIASPTAIFRTSELDLIEDDNAQQSEKSSISNISRSSISNSNTSRSSSNISLNSNTSRSNNNLNSINSRITVVKDENSSKSPARRQQQRNRRRPLSLRTAKQDPSAKKASTLPSRGRCGSRKQNTNKPKQQTTTKGKGKNRSSARPTQQLHSPPVSPLPNGSLPIDPEFLRDFPGIWVKRLESPLVVSPSASPDHFLQ